MTFDPASVATVGKPAPEFLRMAALGAGLRGGITPATVTICEEFLPEEWRSISAGDYGVAVKLYNSGGTVGLVLELTPPGSRMQFFLAYSMAYLRAVGGDDAVQKVLEAVHEYRQDRGPGLGLLVVLVFLDTDEPQTVRGLRAFTLPRMFGDRFLEAVLRTVEQDHEVAADRTIELCGDTQRAWADALPGVAVAGQDLEVSDGEYQRIRRRQRARGRG